MISPDSPADVIALVVGEWADGNRFRVAREIMVALEQEGYEIRKKPVDRPLWPHQCE